MRHFDKNKQKTKKCRDIGLSAKWRLSQLRFWLRRHAGFHQNSHPTPNTETSAFHELRLRTLLFRVGGFLVITAQ